MKILKLFLSKDDFENEHGICISILDSSNNNYKYCTPINNEKDGFEIAYALHRLANWCIQREDANEKILHN